MTTTDPTADSPPASTDTSTWTKERLERAIDAAARWLKGASMADVASSLGGDATAAEGDVRKAVSWVVRGDVHKAEARRLRAILKAITDNDVAEGVVVEIEYANVPGHLLDAPGVQRALTRFTVCAPTLDEVAVARAVGEVIAPELKKIGAYLDLDGTRVEGVEKEER